MLVAQQVATFRRSSHVIIIPLSVCVLVFPGECGSARFSPITIRSPLRSTRPGMVDPYPKPLDARVGDKLGACYLLSSPLL